jgi:peptidoglycan/LPS O-acetylase OafA/YrhL
VDLPVNRSMSFAQSWCLKVPIQMREHREIRSLTGLRGAAAVYVVFHHYFLGLPFTNPFNTFLAHGYLAVDLFFVLSGFVMTLNYAHMFHVGWSRTAMLTFLSRRIARVYPLYLVATTCAFLLIIAGWLENPAAASLKKTFALNLALVQAWGFAPSLDAPGWSISAEWAAYLLFPVLLSLAFFRKPLWGWLSAVSSVAILVILCILPAPLVHNLRPLAMLDLHSSYRGFAVWRCLPEFTLGILAARLLGTPAAVWLGGHRWAPLGLCLGVLAMLAIPCADLGVVLLFPVLILCLASKDNLPSVILGSWPVHYLGVISYSIYLVHDLLGGLLARTHQYAHGHGLAHAQTYAAALGIVLTFPISVCAYKLIESPGRRFLRQLLEETYSPRIQPQRAPVASEVRS